MIILFVTACFFVATHAADVDECAIDPSYGESMKKITAGQNKGTWKEWMVVPKNKTSGYGICYYNALNNMRFNTLQPSIPLADTLMPMCRNLKQEQNSNQTTFDERIMGFECTCPPPTTRQEFRVMKRIGFSCPSLGCPNCRTELNYECVDNKCKCKQGYTERLINATARCVERECGDGELYSPQLIASRHQMRVRCDKVTFRLIAVDGYRLVRENVTNVVVDAVDINECVEKPDICCDNESKCIGPNCVKASIQPFVLYGIAIKCMNTIGSYSCGTASIVCDASYVDKNTCKCQGLACTKTTSWYMDCYGESRIKDLNKEKRVCSRILDAKSKTFMTFDNEQALFDYSVKMKCDCCFLAAKPKTFASNPVVNYYGPCLPTADKVVCPDGARATITSAGPWCTIKAKIFDLPSVGAGDEMGSTVPDPMMCAPLPGFGLFVAKNGKMDIVSA